LKACEQITLQKNAWRAATEVSGRLHNSAGSSAGELIWSSTTPTAATAFFFDEEYVQEFLLKCDGSLPGGRYYSKIFEFQQKHYQMGLKHMEFIRNQVHFVFFSTLSLSFYLY